MNNEQKVFNWEEFAEVKDIIQLLRSTNSKNLKMSYLEQYKDNLMLQQLLFYTYNDFKYKISLEALNKVKASEDKAPVGSPFAMCQELAKSNINDDLRIRVKSYIQYAVPQDCRDLVLNMLLKDQGVGVNVKTINKIWNNLIPEFKVILGNPVKKAKLKESDTIYITIKYNGIRNIYCYGDFRSRQGKVIEGFDCIKDELDKLYESLECNVLDFVLDGELIKINDGVEDEVNFTQTISIVNSKTRSKEDEAKIEYVLFDIIPTNEFFEGESRLKYKKRREQLDLISKHCEELNLKHVRVAPLLYKGKYSKQIVDDMLAKTDSLGLEGIMINKEANYVCKRTNNLLKVKSWFYNDVKIIGYEEGQGEFKGTLGSLIVDYKGYPCGVGSGFKRDERDWVWEHRDELIGRVCTVKCKLESKNNKGELSMNFPIWNGLREVGKEVSYES